MSSTRLSEYFINEFFAFNKNAEACDVQAELNSKIPSIFNYQFKNTALLLEAFTHKSFAHEVGLGLKNNERLEFLGDAVLDLIISKKIFRLFGESKEGELSKLRSTLVNEATLSHIALTNKLDSKILVGKGEIKGRGFTKASVLSDCFEALVGAIFEDSSFDEVEKIVISVFDKYAATVGVDLYSLDTLKDSDPKSKLQEITMKEFKLTPKYESEEVTSGKSKQFKVSIKLQDKVLLTETNISKKKAMQNLAAKVLKDKIYKNFNKEGVC